MPFARLTVIPAPAPELAHRLATDLKTLIARELRKQHDLTSVLIETPGRYDWAIGAVRTETAAHLEVCVTAGTNSEDEKRAFIETAMLVLRQALPGLAEATYIVVKELPAVDWGYDGLTQAFRAAQRIPKPI